MNPMTPSPEQKAMTAEQINKAVANYRALLEKHAPDFSVEPVQIALGQPELGKEQFRVFCRHVEAQSNLIVRRVKVNRTRTSQEMLDATGRTQYTNREVVDAMPKGEGEEVEVIFFKPAEWEYTRPNYMSDDDLEKALERRNLKPDPRAQTAVNEEDKTFADTHPNGTHWKDAADKWNFAAFHLWDVEPEVRVDRATTSGAAIGGSLASASSSWDFGYLLSFELCP